MFMTLILKENLPKKIKTNNIYLNINLIKELV